jgi:hypothetical protein
MVRWQAIALVEMVCCCSLCPYKGLATKQHNVTQKYQQPFAFVELADARFV